MKYMWSNKHSDNTFTKEILDRVVANSQWTDLFRERMVEVLTTRQSDHKPLLLMLSTEMVHVKFRKKGFRFEAK